MGTHFIRQREVLSTAAVAFASGSPKKRADSHNPLMAHGGGGGSGASLRDVVDRTSVLTDLLESEAWFQEAKRKYVESLFRIYDNCASLQARATLRQAMADVIASRPRLDMSTDATRAADMPYRQLLLEHGAAANRGVSHYFSESYACEIVRLTLSVQLTEEVLATQVRCCPNVFECVSTRNNHEFTLIVILGIFGVVESLNTSIFL
jgi:hypothetical protein